MRTATLSRLVAAFLVAFAAAPDIACAQAGVPPPLAFAGGGYAYGGAWRAPGWGCAGRSCYDVFAFRRALQQKELRDEIDARRQSEHVIASIHPTPRYAPPPTPESQLQPRYRGTGEPHAAFLDAGRPREVR